jgi:hypothetical protein
MAMLPPFDIFKLEESQSVLWVESATDLDSAIERIAQLMISMPAEYLILSHRTGNKLRIRPGRKNGDRKPRVFLIDYEGDVLKARAELLKALGCEVDSALGNVAAIHKLAPCAAPCDLFVLGHGGNESERQEMAAFLKSTNPDTEILALSPAGEPELPGAHYALRQDGTEEWLVVVEHALGLGKNGEGL